MLDQFNDMSTDAGWNDAARVSVLMSFVERLVVSGTINPDDFLDFVDEKVADEKAMGETEESLCKEWESYCKENKLPFLSADDVIHRDTLTPMQRQYISKFIMRWEEVVG